MTAVGPITVRVSEGAPSSGDRPATSGVYRNKASVEAMPETYNGCATLYELFNKAVEEHADNRWVWASVGRVWVGWDASAVEQHGSTLRAVWGMAGGGWVLHKLFNEAAEEHAERM